MTHYFGYILLVIVLFHSCRNEDIEQHKEISKEQVKLNNLKSKGFEIVIIDDCEYIVMDRNHGYAGSGGICHKQNCKFCIGRSKHFR